MRKSNAPKKTNSRTVPPKNAFRIAGKNFFFTWPQNPMDKYLVRENIKKLFAPEYNGCVVCTEKHADGSLHLHAIINCDLPRVFSGTAGLKQLDSLTGKHGNYQTARNWRRVLGYVCKDGNYIQDNVDVDVIMRSLESKKGFSWESMAKDIIDKKMELEDLYKEKPGFLLQYRKKAEDFIELCHRFEEPVLLKYCGIELHDVAYPVARSVDEWLLSNLAKPRQIRQKQLWIYGDPDVGKTRLKCELLERFKVYIPPAKEEWWCGLDNTYDGIILDEFEGEKQVTELNLVLDGSPCRLKTKGNQAINKKKNMWVVVLSNMPPECCYPSYIEKNPRGWKGFLERLEIVELKRRDLPVEQVVNEVEMKRYKVNWRVPLFVPNDPSTVEEALPNFLRRQNATVGNPGFLDQLWFRKDVLRDPPSKEADATIVDKLCSECLESEEEEPRPRKIRIIGPRDISEPNSVEEDPTEDSKGKGELDSEPGSESSGEESSEFSL